VLQEGADLWCDTRLIARELERRCPPPRSFPRDQRRRRGIAWWTEHQFHAPVALFVSGINADHMPPACTRIAPACDGLPAPRSGGTQGGHAQPPSRAPQIQWLADMLQDGRSYLLGDQPASPIRPSITVICSSRAAT